MSNKTKSKIKKKKTSSQSKISAHKKKGSKLISPFNQIDNISYQSWRDERLPCMIWVSLLIAGLKQEKALDIVRAVGFYISKRRC